MIAKYIIPVFLGVVFFYAVYKKINIFQAFTEGAVENLKVAVDIFPALLGLVACVGLLKSSGILGGLALIVSPLTQMANFPAECVPLALIKPVSGSGSTAVLSDILKTYGADSLVGRVASVIAGSTETVFYTIAVYSSSIKSKTSLRVIISALLANLVAILLSNYVVRLYFY